MNTRVLVTDVAVILAVSAALVLISVFLRSGVRSSTDQGKAVCLCYPVEFTIPRDIPVASLEYSGIPGGDPPVTKVFVLGHVQYMEGYYSGWYRRIKSAAEGLEESYDLEPWLVSGRMIAASDHCNEVGFIAGAEACRRKLMHCIRRFGREATRQECLAWLRLQPHLDRSDTDVDE